MPNEVCVLFAVLRHGNMRILGTEIHVYNSNIFHHYFRRLTILPEMNP